MQTKYEATRGRCRGGQFSIGSRKSGDFEGHRRYQVNAVKNATGRLSILNKILIGG